VSERRSHLILVGLIVAALVGVALLAVPGSPLYKKPTLGLDLQGGLEVVLQAEAPKGHKLTQSDLDRSVNIIRNRIDKLGVSEPIVTKQGSNQISIQLAGVHDQARAAQIIGKTARLELYDLETALVPPSTTGGLQPQPVATRSLYRLLSAVQGRVQGRSDAWYLFRGRKLVAGPEDTRAALLERYGGEVPKGTKVLGVPPRTVVITCGAGDTVCPGVNESPPTRMYYYLFRYTPSTNPPVPQMTGNDLKLSGTRQDYDTQSGQPIVLMKFTGKGGRIFQDITRAEYQRGKLQQAPQHFAIVLDRDIKSWPQIDYTDSSLSGGIGGGSAQIQGIGSLREAKDIALVLQTGALPVDFKTVEQSDVSATLGKDSLRQAYIAAIAGLIAVALFLLFFYRFLGLVAVIGLGIYAALLYAAVLLFNVTLTLPGFAGAILTIGVAADANVVIFERIKEEARAGKSMRAAIAAGYGKGFHTIIDANVVTMITALVLFAVATAGVKGFALVLLIGTAISMLTAVAATRAMLGMLAGFRWFDSPRFMGAQGQQSAKWLQVDFMRRRYLWLAISGAVIAVGIGSLAVRGLNLGIDFKGGTQVTFKTPQPVSLADVRSQANSIGQAGDVIQGRGNRTGAESYKQFQVRAKEMTNPQYNSFKQNLEQKFQADSFGRKTVSSSFGRQIMRSAILAILFSLFLIICYTALRFQWKFAVAVIAALLHDIIITVGVYSLTGREVTTATVAAVLTVLGYSIYDTIIIFDRIRENIPLMRRSPFATIANVSLWETIRRSLATTFITLLPVASILFFGGDTLKDFAFALLVGIGSGAYSSIFIAAPLLTMMKEREPEYARRVGREPERRDAAAVLEEAEEAAAEEPAPVPELVPVAGRERAAADAKRERRRQRRRSRPHGRAR
jgi:SecD/SecF fusion protein